MVCLQAAIADTEPDTMFFELLELDETLANDIIEILLASLHKYGFDDLILGECFVALAYDGASVRDYHMPPSLHCRPNDFIAPHTKANVDSLRNNWTW